MTVRRCPSAEVCASVQHALELKKGESDVVTLSPPPPPSSPPHPPSPPPGAASLTGAPNSYTSRETQSCMTQNYI